jgi:hypothetical protein
MTEYMVYTVKTDYFATKVKANSEAEAMQFVEDNPHLLIETYDSETDVWSAEKIERKN